ncbi:MAG: DNA mismatch repair protein MutS [Flavobacteriaceae bacterium]|nr:DNA mismatch repair protein MutS [Flavobacteriaceae bacterium]
MQPKSYYQKRLEELQQELQKNRKFLRIMGFLRLCLFLSALFVMYFGYPKWSWSWLVSLLLLLVFFRLMLVHKKWKRQKRMLQIGVGMQQRELRLLASFDKSQEDGAEFSDPLHAYSSDMDLFGWGSLYQYLNRTALQQGSQQLAQLLKANRADGIASRQQAIQELTNIADWRQDYEIQAQMVPQDLDLEKQLEYVAHYQVFLPKSLRYVTWAMSLISVVVIAGYFAEWLHGAWLFVCFFVGAGIMMPYLKKINRLGSQLDKLQEVFRAYGFLLEQIENKEFASELLKEKKATLVSEKERSSAVIQSFSRLLDRFDQRNNMLIGVPANGFFLRDIWVVLDIERWMEQHQKKVASWFAVLAWFDAMQSLSNFAFNHPHFVYPDLVQNGQIQARDLGHPLIANTNCVYNDFKIDSESFFIVTGANMAGKSTFLRTVGLAIIMANTGLPVCAKSMKYKPIKLISSMRTEDSLNDNTSYFFAELSRLKYIVNTIKQDNYFIILDEILKGTNSVDKAEGSAKFIRKLSNSQNTGIIATHDLSLCELQEQIGGIQNYYFDAEIKNDELFFDYQLKEGICQNMNASFLLRKMEII